jgi:hypothetical protein
MDFYILREGNPTGPFSKEAIAEMLSTGELTEEDYGWSEGMEDWSPVKAILSKQAAPPATASFRWWRAYLEPNSIALGGGAVIGAVVIASLITWLLLQARPSAAATDVNTWGIGGGKAFATYYKLLIENPSTFVLSKTGGSVELPISAASDFSQLLNDLSASAKDVKHYSECVTKPFDKYLISQRTTTGGYSDPVWGRKSSEVVQPFLRISRAAEPDEHPAMDEIVEIDVAKMSGLLGRVSEVEQTFLAQQSAIATWKSRLPVVWLGILATGLIVALSVPWIARALNSRKGILGRTFLLKGGLNRGLYALILLAFGVAIALVQKTTPSPEYLRLSVLTLAFIALPLLVVATAMRLHSVGRSAVWALLLFVPLVNLGCILYCLVVPPLRPNVKGRDWVSIMVVVLGLFALGKLLFWLAVGK